MIVLFPSSFAQTTKCTFGDALTSDAEKFAKDLAVQAFLEKHPDATRIIPTDESGSAVNQIVFHSSEGIFKETLKLKFNVDRNGCYIPAYYDYLYDDGTINPAVRNSVGNFTEIVTLIKTDNKTIRDFYPDDCQFVDLDVSMTSGQSYGVCKEINSMAVTILIDSDSDGSLEIDLPIRVVYSLPSQDCKPTGDFVVLLDKSETNYEITSTEIGNQVQVEFTEGFHKISVMGSVIIPSPSPVQYCGIVEGHLDKKYMSPLDQTDHGMKPNSVKCNEGLILIQKYNGSPACVKPETIPRLMERNWIKDDAKQQCETFSGIWNKDFATCFDFSDEYDCKNMGGKPVSRSYTGEQPDYSKKSDSFACEFRK